MRRRFATEENRMVGVASRSPFASRRRSPPAPAADRGHRGARHVAAAVAMGRGDSRPPPSHPSARLLAGLLPLLEVLLLAHRAPPAHASVVDNGNSVPRLDASAAKKTIPVSPLHYARQPRPTARTAAGSPHNLAGLEIAVGFEARHTARPLPFLQPLFWLSLIHI